MAPKRKVIDLISDDEGMERSDSDELPDIDLKISFQTAATSSHNPKPAKKQMSIKDWTSSKLQTATSKSSDTIRTLFTTKSKARSSSDDEDGGSEQLSDDDDDDDLETSIQMPSVSTVWTASKPTTASLRSKATTMLQLMVMLTWACFTAPAYKAHVFPQIFTDADVLSQVLSAASLTFCAGIFGILQAVEPPTIAFFKRLPSQFKGVWAIYVLVLEKNGCKTKIYIGSGTDASYSVQTRMWTYDRVDWNAMPMYVAAALRDGYEIKHKGLLVWCPIPSASNVPKFRLLFLAMEATFSFLFWAMRSESKDYGMGAFCLWERASLTYGGLCSHSALVEGRSKGLDLTDEQLEAMATEAKEKQKRVRSKYYFQRREADLDGWRAYKNAYEKRSGKKAGRQKKSLAKAKAAGKHRCEACNLNCYNAYTLRAHNLTTKHKRNAARAAVAAGSSKRST